MLYVTEGTDSIFLSYWKILYILNAENITKKNGSKISKQDLKQAILIMIKKTPIV